MMDDEVEACAERVRHHLRRPLVGSRNLPMNTAGNTMSETVPLTGSKREITASDRKQTLDKTSRTALSSSV